MPVYEFRCDACGNAFSKLFRSATSEARATCPACGAERTTRALSSFAYHASLQTRIDSIDPAIERELDWADRHHKGNDPLSRLNLDASGPSGA